MIYLDSCIVIYLVEKHPVYYTPLEAHFYQHLREGFAISPLVVLECLVHPLKHKDVALQNRFERFFSLVTRLPMEEAVFIEAAAKRATFSLKTPDALHLATAEHYSCSGFWTNDDRLKNVSPLAVKVV
jgi:uncharacterized protein